MNDPVEVDAVATDAAAAGLIVLEVLLESDCQQDWQSLSQKLKTMLFKLEVCSDYKTDEVLCVLHAFTMIMQQDCTKEKKQELKDLKAEQAEADKAKVIEAFIASGKSADEVIAMMKPE